MNEYIYTGKKSNVKPGYWKTVAYTPIEYEVVQVSDDGELWETATFHYMLEEFYVVDIQLPHNVARKYIRRR